MADISLSDLVESVRYLIEDFGETDTYVDEYENSNIFTLPEENATAVSDVRVNGVSSGVSYSYNSSTNKVTITSALSSGDSIEIDYSYYSNYSESEIKKYIRSALLHLSTKNYFDFTVENEIIYPAPLKKEQNLIAMIASVLIKPDNNSYSLPDIRITVPRGSLSTHDLISKIVAISKKNSHGVFDIL